MKKITPSRRVMRRLPIISADSNSNTADTTTMPN